MADRLRSRASFWTQSNALLRKNATFQKRNVCSNLCLFLIPALLCLILFGLDRISKYGDNTKPKAKYDCDWRSTDPTCPILNPQEWPPLLSVPFEPCTDDKKASSCHLNVLATGNNQSLGQLLAGNMFSVDWNSTNVLDYMAGNVMGTMSGVMVSSVFEDGAFSYPEFIKVQQKCSPNNSTFSIPLLGSEVQRRPPHEVVRRLASTAPFGRSTPKPPQPRRPIPNPPPVRVQPRFRNQPGPNLPQARTRHSPALSPARNPPQTSSSPPTQSPSLTPNSAQSPVQAPSPSPFSVLRREAQATALARDSSPSWDQKDEGKTTEIRCIEALPLWRNTSSDVNNELYKGSDRTKHSQILAAYDFSNSNENNFNLTVWYNPSSRLYVYGNGKDRPSPLRVGRSINLASNAYLQFLQGSGTKILFEFIKEMPKPVTGVPELDVASMFSGLFFTWIILLLFPVVLKTLVYEKQQKLRIMMKMHGLGDGPYWLISYGYFLTVCTIYMLVFVAVGSLLGFKLFTINDYSIQFVFFFLYINLQISAAFLVATLFSNVKACTVVAYILVFGTGLLAEVFVPSFIKDPSHSSHPVILLQMYPGFALYRGLYELASYPLENRKVGMRWGDFSYARRGMRDLLIFMLIEWFVVLFVAYYIDQVVSSGGAKGPFFFLQRFRKKKPSSPRKYSLRSQGSNVAFQMEKPDVVHEIEVVERLVMEGDTSHAIVCDNIKKVYPGRDGNPEKYAVKGLSLALPPGECFGMLGPNGAGKTSFISMMTGLTKSTSGTAYVHGMDIQTRMDDIYSSMGFCPQHDLLWETLTGREHLLFYGRLKNLKGSALKQAVNESLKSVNLFHGGVADKQAGKYSGGMKRRLSVAISLIGDPKVVYMDEPSTGLDPASRNHLWNVIKSAKQDRAIILTTHSMEEAEVLCDRLGIFVDGRMQCIGNPKELKARYGGSYIFTMTTSWEHEQEVERMVQHLSPNANKTYRLSGTQKFELPRNEVSIADVFQTVEYAKSRFPVFAWGVADTTLEDVFIKVATTGSSPVTLS